MIWASIWFVSRVAVMFHPTQLAKQREIGAYLTTKYELVRALDFEAPCHFIGWHRTYPVFPAHHTDVTSLTPFVGRLGGLPSHICISRSRLKLNSLLTKLLRRKMTQALYYMLVAVGSLAAGGDDKKILKVITSYHRSKRLVGAGSTSSSKFVQPLTAANKSW
jgi:hypothetical protein